MNDLLDGWARDPDLHPPRIPEVSYAVIDLKEMGLISSVAINESLDILDVGGMNAAGVQVGPRLWRNGGFIPIPITPVLSAVYGQYYSYFSYSLSDAGEVIGSQNGDNFLWSPTGGSQLLEEDFQIPGVDPSMISMADKQLWVEQITAAGSILGRMGDRIVPVPHDWPADVGVSFVRSETSSDYRPLGDPFWHQIYRETYFVREMSVRSGRSIYPYGENRSGVIVGSTSTFTAGRLQPSDAEGLTGAALNAFMALPPLATSTPRRAMVYEGSTMSVIGTDRSIAYAMNDNAEEGMIVGEVNGQAAFWFGEERKEKILKDAQTQASVGRVARQVNNRGEILGDFGLMRNGAIVDLKRGGIYIHLSK